jgi:four helix bundle protein
VGDYRNLSVWKKAHCLSLEIYRATASFPASERFSLVAQLRRSATSIVSNIAEGAGRQNDRELVRFLRIARGSAWELECQLLLSRDMDFIERERHLELEAQCQEVSKMLMGLVRSSRQLRPVLRLMTRDS